MKAFLQKHADRVTGILSGFDRVVLRAILRPLTYVQGLNGHLRREGICFDEFATYCTRLTGQLKSAALKQAEELGRPILYLRSSSISKEETALQVAREQGITQGLICNIKVLENSQSYELHKSRQTKAREYQHRIRRCLHIYRYWYDDEMGLMGARIQTWLPFNVQLWFNGREWLSRQLDREGIAYERHDNCFAWVENFPRAQQLLNEQLRTDWPRLVERVVEKLNPAHLQMFKEPMGYYAMSHQTEWATDVAFSSREALEAVYPQLAWGALTSFRSEDVLKYLDLKSAPELEASYCDFTQGIRVRHSAGFNSIKMYNKPDRVLRVETTVNDPSPFKTLDAQTGKWRPSRKGVSDLHRRAEVSEASNERYLDALSTLDDSRQVVDVVQEVCKGARLGSQKVRALRPWSKEDRALLEAVGRGEFLVNGLRNRDLLALLFPGEHGAQERRRLAGRVTTKLRILRGHGIVRKVPGTHRYMVTQKGRQVITTLLKAQKLTTEQLTRIAA